ncbi:Adenosylcobinamide-phosphate synthase [Salinispira pacifica]|uniref:Cobalamin biosynthesis protein CobD n=1 Tax=Salinispira pacifica TaxID=1307761 RepID=V5WHX2_9SPIO|nr:Adenosylcobinamide-phosphate synthase [Salinispira pacifica]
MALTAMVLIVTAISALAVPLFLSAVMLVASRTLTADALTIAFGSFLLSFSFSSHELNASGRRVHRALVSGDIPEARKRLSMIVSRQTAELGHDEIIRGTVESLSENWLDSVAAPLMWALLGAGLASLGAVGSHSDGIVQTLAGLLAGAWGYRCVNTLDAMWGYRSRRYERFGKAAARLDDCLNFLPARLAAPLLVIAALAVPGSAMFRAAAVCGMDGRKSRSPNSGWVEAACAGAIGIGLGGPARYAGQLVDNPLIGEGVAIPDHISRAIALNRAALALILVIIGAVLVLLMEHAGVNNG